MIALKSDFSTMKTPMPKPKSDQFHRSMPISLMHRGYYSKINAEISPYDPR